MSVHVCIVDVNDRLPLKKKTFFGPIFPPSETKIYEFITRKINGFLSMRQCRLRGLFSFLTKVNGFF